MHFTNHLDGQTYTVNMKGDFTFADNHSFREILQSITTSNQTQIVFNLKDVEYIDSAALGLLLLAQDEAAKSNKKKVVLQGAQGQVQKMFSAARFEQFFEIT